MIYLAFCIFQCNAGVAAYKMFQSLAKPPTKIMLMGGGCSTESEATAQTCHLFNVTQVNILTVHILCIGTDRSQQTVQTKIRLLLKKQSDQGLRCLPFHQHLLDA